MKNSKKNLIKSLFAVGVMGFSCQAFAWTRLATCGTGDALEGMDIFTDGENVIVQVLKYEETPNGQGATVADEYRTNSGAVNPVEINPTEIMQKLSAGENLSFVVTKDDSFTFGGLDSKAALLNVKLNAADPNNQNHYNRDSALAFEGSVGHFFCY